MKSASYGLIGLAVLLVVLGLVNHFVLHLNPVDHTSTIIGGVAAVLGVAGVAMFVMGGRAAR